MTTPTPHLNAPLTSLTAAFVAAAALAATVSVTPNLTDALAPVARSSDVAPLVSTAGARTAQQPSVATRGPRSRIWTITYTAHNGVDRNAEIIAPATYGPRNPTPPLPLVISPHGRAGSGRSNARYWGDLPGVGGFVVVNPDGMGRKLKYFSYGYKGQIDDLARMPQLVETALPWLHVDPKRIYALGSSMGGQETLLLVARHPELLAGAAAMDSVTDLSRRYDQLPTVPCDSACLKRYGEPRGVNLQRVMRREVGGTPKTSAQAFASRSALSLAGRIASSGVPLQIWWSSRDRIVSDQRHQSGELFRTLRRTNGCAPVSAYIGIWKHSAEMRSTSLLPIALADFGILRRGLVKLPHSVQHVRPAATGSCS